MPVLVSVSLLVLALVLELVTMLVLISEIAKTAKVLRKRVSKILQMRRFCAENVPRLLTFEQN